MSFLPDWWSQGTTGNDNNGGFGTAAMFNQPTQRGDLTGLINALRNKFSPTQKADDLSMVDTNSLPSFTPYQTTPIGPNMGKIEDVYGLGPDGRKSIFPNYNRTYGGY